MWRWSCQRHSDLLYLFSVAGIAQVLHKSLKPQKLAYAGPDDLQDEQMVG